MPTLHISREAEVALTRIAGTGDLQARIEVARLIATLKFFREKMANAPAFWNIAHSASGAITSRATLKNGTPLWRLHPAHAHCIGLMAMHDGDLHVLAICNEAEIITVELGLTRLDP